MKPILLFCIALLSTNCEKDYSQEFPYHPPAETRGGLQVGTLQEVHMDENMMRKAVGRINNGKYGEIHSMLIYKDNLLVFEDYYEGHQYQWEAPGHYGAYISWDRDKQHCIHSDTKSITSLCIGIAIDQGFIESVHQSIFEYLPDYQNFRTPEKEKITIEHLLTMTSGFEWDEWGVSLSSVENDQIGIWFWEEGPMDYILSRDLVAEPGTRFNYSGGDIQILVEILRNATGMTLDEFSSTYLFGPMGIDTYDWWLIFPTGEIQGAGGLKLTPRDMVKLGAMMMNDGVWEGTRIISEEWVSKCRSPYAGNTGIKVPGEDLGRVGYAYTWWTRSFRQDGLNIGMYLALGWGGQKIMVLPELDMIVVFTGANYNSNVHQFEILERFILPAIL
ncbi:MAG: serine hydrolase domain-containing protein [Bacteroidales bacterium]